MDDWDWEEQERREREERERREAEERERQRREQRKREIRGEIDRLNGEIGSLEDRKRQYQNMKNKINQALPKLRSAKQNVTSSNSGLKNAYSSQTAEKEIRKFQEKEQQINEIISNLNGSILPEIDRKINSLNNEIQNRRNRIGQLQGELNSL